MERNDSLEHLFSWDRDIDGWASKIMVFITYYEKSEYVVFVKLVTPGIQDRDYSMKWVVSEHTGMPAWEFQPTPGMVALPDELLALEDDISDAIIEIDLSPYSDDL
jgi:hypothetical protein